MRRNVYSSLGGQNLPQTQAQPSMHKKKQVSKSKLGVLENLEKEAINWPDGGQRAKKVLQKSRLQQSQNSQVKQAVVSYENYTN